jgi:hypothetical protein
MAKTNPSFWGRFWKPLGVIVFCLFFLLVISVNLSPFLDSQKSLMDFGSFYASGLQLAKNENPYDANSDYVFEILFPKVGAGGKMVNLNPPISLLFLRPLVQADPYHAMLVWQVVSAVLYAISVLLLTSTYQDRLSPAKFVWAFMLAGFWHTIVLGQIYIVLLLLAALAWIFLRREQYAFAGIALGLLVAVKPNFLIWPLFLLIAGYSMSAIVSTLTAILVSAIPIFIYGMKVYTQWMQASALRPETLIMPGNNSIPGLVGRFSSLPLAIVISVLVVLALLACARWREATSLDRVEYISALGVIASLLASPIAWTGYTILLLPIFFSLKRWSIPVIFSAIVLAIPFQIVLQLFQTSFASFVVFGWLYGWAILSLLGMLVRNTMMTRSIQTN